VEVPIGVDWESLSDEESNKVCRAPSPECKGRGQSRAPIYCAAY